MERIIDLHLRFYESLQEHKEFLDSLASRNIRVLDGFIHQVETVRNFYSRYYSDPVTPRIVLCGINPGRKGAGKTGVPFLDFLSLSKLMPNIANQDWESSAQFIFDVIQNVGSELFFRHVYLTNISWFGFVEEKNGKVKNLNYYKLPEREQKFFTRSFLEEMEIVNPSVILPLSREVEKSLLDMKKTGLLSYEIGARLNHPFYCGIPKNRLIGMADYRRVIKGYIESAKTIVV